MLSQMKETWLTTDYSQRGRVGDHYLQFIMTMSYNLRGTNHFKDLCASVLVCISPICKSWKKNQEYEALSLSSYFLHSPEINTG